MFLQQSTHYLDASLCTKPWIELASLFVWPPTNHFPFRNKLRRCVLHEFRQQICFLEIDIYRKFVKTDPVETILHNLIRIEIEAVQVPAYKYHFFRNSKQMSSYRGMN